MNAAWAVVREFAGRYTRLPAVVHVLCLGSLLNRAGSFVMVFLSIYASEKLGLGIQYATLCVGAIGLGSVISSLVGGQLADLYGRRTVMVFALFSGAVMLVAMSMLSSGIAFLSSIFVFALVMEMYRPACGAMIGDVVDSAQRPYAFGLMYIAINLGFAVSSPVGGYLASVDFRWLFWGDAVTTAGFGLIVLLLIPETLPRRRQDVAPDSAVPAPVMGLEDFSEEAREILPQRPHAAAAERPKSSEFVPLTKAIRQIAADSTFLLYCLCNLLTCIVFMQAFSTLPLHLRSLGYSSAQYGNMVALNGVMIVVLQLPMTHLLKRYNAVALILAGECLLALGFGLTAYAETTGMILGTIALWSLGEIIQAPFKQAIVADLAPAAMRARYMGVFTVSFSMAMLVGAPLGGLVLENFGSEILWLGCFCVTLTAIGIYSVLYRRLNLACQERTMTLPERIAPAMSLQEAQ